MHKLAQAIAAVLFAGALALGGGTDAHARQDTREARIAAAHALLDEAIVTNYDPDVLLRELSSIEVATAEEQTAIIQAFHELFPLLVRDAQTLSATGMAEHFSLQEIQNPNTIADAEFEAFSAETSEVMYKLGSRFAHDVLSKGCGMTRAPSPFCEGVLAAERPTLD